MNKKLLHYSIYALFGLLTLFGIFKAKSWGDEKSYHLPLAKDINFEMVLDESSNYSSAYAPLPYFIGNLIYRVSGSVTTLRLLNWVIALITF